MYEKTIKVLAFGEWLPGFLSVGRIKVERSEMLCKTNLSTGLKGQRQTRREALTISVLRLVMGTSLIRLTHGESETRFFYEKTWLLYKTRFLWYVCVQD